MRATVSFVLSATLSCGAEVSAHAENAEASAAAASTAPVTLSTVTVRQSNARTAVVDGYKAEHSSTGARIDAPLQDQPLSVTVISRQLIEDLGVRNLTDIADLVAGVARETTGYSPFGTSYFIRGFSSYGAASTLNGFRLDGFLGSADTSAVENVEFLKGPASVLYGSSSAISGIANTVTKRPTADDRTTVELEGGMFGHVRASVDANHPLGSDALLGRVNIAAERDNGFRAYPGSRSNTLFAITPIVSAQLSPTTRAELELSAVRTKYGGRCDGMYAVPALLALSIRKQAVCDDLAHASLDTYTSRLEVVQELDANWSVRVAGFYGRSNSERTEEYPVNYGDPLSADGHTIERYNQFVTSYSSNAAGQFELRGHVRTGALRHQLIGGLEWTRAYSPYAFYVAPATPIDIVDTQYNGQQLGDFTPDGPGAYSKSLATGLYLQDFIELGREWKLLAGLRHDSVRSASGEVSPTTVDEQQSETANSPRVGLVWQPRPSTSFYIGWARSFSPNTGARDRQGNIFPAERGVQYEAGVKQDLLDRQLNVTATVFDIRRTHVLNADPTDPTGNFSIATGEQRSTGAEVEVLGRVTADWSVIGAYTYLDARVTKDDSIPIGNGLVGAARHAGSIWNKLALAGWSLPGWSVGVGLTASGDREAQLPNIPITLGGYARLDAAVYYEVAGWKAQLNAKNLTDRRIFTGQGSQLYPQSPRSVTGSVSTTF